MLEQLNEAVVDDDAIRSLTTDRTFTNVNTRSELDEAEQAIAAVGAE